MHTLSKGGERYFQNGTALNRVLLEAPYLPRCSDDKTATRVRPREYAIRYPYMQVNRTGFVSWLIFDLDHDRAMEWEDVGLPAPNLIVRNRQNGHSHLYYAITPVCTSEAGRAKPIAYMKAVYAAFARLLNADPDFHSGPVAKTPNHPWWITHELHSQVYELGTLADYVDLEVASPWRKQASIEPVSHSRHCILFEYLRHYAYSVVNRERERGTLASFTRLLEAYAHNRNSFARLGFEHNLPQSSLRATVKSVARWTWERYRGNGRCHRGVMQLSRDLPLQDRQRLAATRTHAERYRQTANKILASCRKLLRDGTELTLTAVAALSRLSRQTVAKYRDILATARLPVTEPIGIKSTPACPVKYGTHQVPAESVRLGIAPFRSTGSPDLPLLKVRPDS